MAYWLPLHLRSMGYSFWIEFWIEFQNRINPSISAMTAAWWHLWQLGMQLSTMQWSGIYGTPESHALVPKIRRASRASRIPREWPASTIARVASNAKWWEDPLLRMKIPMLRSLYNSCSERCAVPWYHPSEGVKICCSSSMMPRAIQMSTYWSTSWKLWRDWKNGRHLDWAIAISVVGYLEYCTPMQSVLRKTPYETSYGSQKNGSFSDCYVFGWLAVMHIRKEKWKQLDQRSTAGISIGCSILTKKDFVYDPLAQTHHHSQDSVFREAAWYTAPIAADKAIPNEHFYRDGIEEPKPTEKQTTKFQME